MFSRSSSMLAFVVRTHKKISERLEHQEDVAVRNLQRAVGPVDVDRARAVVRSFKNKNGRRAAVSILLEKAVEKEIARRFIKAVKDRGETTPTRDEVYDHVEITMAHFFAFDDA